MWRSPSSLVFLTRSARYKDQAIFPTLAGEVDKWSHPQPPTPWSIPSAAGVQQRHPQGIQPLAEQKTCRKPSVSFLDDGVAAGDTLLVSQGLQAIQQVARSVGATSSTDCIANPQVGQRPALLQFDAQLASGPIFKGAILPWFWPRRVRLAGKRMI